MMSRVKDWMQRVCCHRNVYGALCGCHGFAAWATGKPEVYVPMAVLYLLLAAGR